MKKKLANIGLVAILVIAVFAGIIGIASAQTIIYNKAGNYIEGINVSVNTTSDFNESYINEPLTFQVNNTLNATATSFKVTNQTGLRTNATAILGNNEWFWVNATEAGTYWVNISNTENQSEYVNFTMEYSSPPAPPAPPQITTYNKEGNYIEGINVSVNTTSDFNESYINEPLTFQVNNTLNATATSFKVTTETGLTTNASATVGNDEWFWVNATEPGTYWVNVSNNENQSEYVNFTVEYSSLPSPPQEITIRIKPETLNLASKGVFTVFITLPADYDVRDINLDTVECEGARAVRGMVSEEYTGTYIAKFNRQDLEVTTGDAVELTVTWELNDGTQFEGTDTIRVIERGARIRLLPDHPFYKVKRWSERVHKFVTFDDASKARLHMRFSEARLAEAEAMIQLGKPEWAGGLMEDYQKELDETHQCMQRQSQKGKPVADLAEYVCNATEEQAEILADLVDEVSEEEKPYMERAINASSKGHIRALEVIKEEKPERAAQLSAGFAEKRMIRAREMYEAGKHEQAQRMLRKYDESMEEAEKAMNVAENRGLNVSELAEHVGNMTYEHVEVLEELLDEVPEHDKPQIEDAIDAAIHRHETYANKAQKGLQKKAEKDDKTGTGKKVKETGNSEKKRGPK